MSNLNINYNHLEINLRECGSDWFASQCHGLICARLSVLGPSSLGLCLEQIFEHTDEETPKLKVFSGPDHDHVAQQPIPLETNI